MIEWVCDVCRTPRWLSSRIGGGMWRCAMPGCRGRMVLPCEVEQ